MRTRTLLFASGVLLLLIGVLMLWSPERFLGQIGLLVSTVDARNEARGGYGGMHLAFGGFALLGAMRAELRRPAVWLVTLLSAGYVFGRTLGVALDGMPSGLVLGAFAIELAGAALGALCLRSVEVRS
jgi:hypothetical protein